jgi:alpha-beta hydrolase superfamily lysophospholipase
VSEDATAAPATVLEGWFPGGKRPMDPLQLGFVHVPAGGRARGAVVLCPSIGKEHIVSYRGLRLAAQKLCDAGLLVVRFDYPGTGDSLGEQTDPAAVRRWIAGTAAAVELARSTGAGDVALVGLRAGALLAAQVAIDVGPLHALCLWDPVLRGRSLARQQQAVYRFTMGEDNCADNVVSLVSMVLDRAAVEELSAMRIKARDLAGAARNLLIATRPTESRSADLSSLLALDDVSQLVLPNQIDWLERESPQTIIPTQSIAQVATWIASTFSAQAVPIVVPDLAHRVQVGVTMSGEPVHEEIVRTGRNNIFSITTRPEMTNCSVVLIAPSKEHRVGPARMWTELARELATRGAETVRFDRRGTGETADVVADEQTPICSAESVVDLLEVAVDLRHRDQGATLVGLSSGSWMAIMAAIECTVGSVVLLSPLNWSTKPATPRPRATAAVQRVLDSAELPHVDVAQKASPRVGRTRLKRIWARHVPYEAVIGLARVGLVVVPELALAALARAGVRTVVFLPPDDFESFVRRRGLDGMRRLARRSRAPELIVSKTGDHSLLHRGTRRRAMDIVLEAVSG